MLTTFPQCNIGLEFPKILSQNYIVYHRLSVLGNSEIHELHCGILLRRPNLDFITSSDSSADSTYQQHPSAFWSYHSCHSPLCVSADLCCCCHTRNVLQACFILTIWTLSFYCPLFYTDVVSNADFHLLPCRHSELNVMEWVENSDWHIFLMISALLVTY